MRPSFLLRLVNGPLYDPVLYVRIVNEKRALMFDCGYFRAMADRELLALDTICISHAHMNHFMGFDTILRTILHRNEPLNIYGPEGIIGNVLSKLQAYTWNLSSDYALEIRIHEIVQERINIVRARAATGFTPSDEQTLPRTGAVVATTQRYHIEAVILDHFGIPCLGYALREPFHINIRKGVLVEKGYITGSWLGRLKNCILAGRPEETLRVKTSSGYREISAAVLKEELVVITEGQSIAYVTDIACTGENLHALNELGKGMNSLFIETFYLDELRGSAIDKGHLTAAQAGKIAALLKAKHAFPMHVSPRYHDRIDEITAELENARKENPGRLIV